MLFFAKSYNIINFATFLLIFGIIYKSTVVLCLLSYNATCKLTAYKSRMPFSILQTVIGSSTVYVSQALFVVNEYSRKLFRKK